MHGLYLMKAFETIQNLFEDICGFFLSEPSFFWEIRLNITAFTKLSYDENIFVRLEWVNVFNDILVMTRSQHFDLSLNELFEFRFFMNSFERYGFNCNGLLCIWIDGFIDDRISSSTKFAYQWIAFKFFAHKAFLFDFHFIIIFL